MKIFVTKFAVFQPSPSNPSESPKLDYVDPLFKRRLSQISRMTIEAVHSLGNEISDLKLVFASFRGEIARQLKINKGLVEDASVMPASFSISVFNTPPAVATIALKLKNGYTAVYPSQKDFYSAFAAASASVLAHKDEKIIFAYGDEYIPEEYRNCDGYTDESPLAFACILSLTPCKECDSKCVEIELDPNNSAFSSPQNFLKFLQDSSN